MGNSKELSPGDVWVRWVIKSPWTGQDVSMEEDRDPRVRVLRKCRVSRRLADDRDES